MSTQSERRSLTPASTKLPLKLYKGPEYTIEYPADWKVSTTGTEVAFNDVTGNYNLTIGETSNPNGSVTADQLANGGVIGAKTNLKNPQDIRVPAQITLSNQTWSQRALSGTSTYNGQDTEVEAGIIATNHPSKTEKTRGYVIAYVSLKKLFDQAKVRYFTPILSTFKFTS